MVGSKESIYMYVYSKFLFCFLAEFFPPLWFLCITSFNHWLLIVNASCNFFIYCSVGKNFKTTIVKFIRRTPFRHCLCNGSNNPEINVEDVEENNVPMKINAKSENTKDQSRGIPISQPNSQITVETFANQSTKMHGLSSDKEDAIDEISTPKIAIVKEECFREDGKTENGVVLLGPK